MQVEVIIDAREYKRYFAKLQRTMPKLLHKIIVDMGTEMKRVAQSKIPIASGEFRSIIRKKTRDNIVTLYVDDPRAMAWEYGYPRTVFLHRDTVSASGYRVGDYMGFFQNHPNAKFVRIPRPGSLMSKGVGYMQAAFTQSPFIFNRIARNTLMELNIL